MKLIFDKMNIIEIIILCIFTISTSQTNNIDIKNVDKEQLKRSLDNARSSKDNKKIIDNLLNDNKDEFGEIPASEDTLVQNDTQEDLSFYENMIKGTIIEPDELLDNIDIFGHSVFRKSKSPLFTTKHQISIPSDYPVANGDEIIITMWGRINEEVSRTVDRDGKINVPRIGLISVAGLLFKDVQQKLTNRLQSIEGVRASVSIGTLSDIRVFIIGEVNIPGQYTMSALTNVTNALFYADGFSKKGSMRNVKLIRNGNTLAVFDFYDFLFEGNNFSSHRLQTGDVILVPVVKKMAAIVGNVRRSGLYELKENPTLINCISLAGGITPTAWINRIQVERFEENKQQVVFDIKTKPNNKLPNFKIEDGDIIKIFPVILFDKNAVVLSGNVLRPGKYEFHKNMRVSGLINKFEMLQPETYFDYAVIRRKEPPSFAPRIISFNLGEIFNDTNSASNKYLKPYDEIIIYHQDHFEPHRVVSIGGSVTNPGQYKLLENMRVKDLILEAGGLGDKASNDRGELYKRIFNKDSVSTKKIDFSISAAMLDDPDHNHLLSKFDHISIRQKTGWEDKKTITLYGEFVYPGTYIVLEGESLGHLLTRAGGFKPEAYLSAAIYRRESVKDLEKRRNEDYINILESDILSLSKEEVSPDKTYILEQQKALVEKLKTIGTIGRIVVNFEKPENYQSLEIEDGDEIFMPKNHSTVSVIGEVFNPSTFVLEKRSNDALHYIQLAGGFKENANKRDVYVIKANGSVRTKKMVRLSRYKLEAGDAVVIPLKIQTSNQKFRMFLETTTNLLSITTNSLLIATSIETFIKNK